MSSILGYVVQNLDDVIPSSKIDAKGTSGEAVPVPGPPWSPEAVPVPVPVPPALLNA